MSDFSVQWHITQRCLNHCKHCYMEDSSFVLSFEDYLSCIDNIESFEKKYDFKISNYIITGGDPFLNNNWFDISLDLVKRGKTLSFLGNPELLSDDILEKLSQLSISSYQLSIDGLKATHDSIRGEGSFSRTICAIKKLSSYNIPISVMYTVSNDNEQELFDVIQYLDALNIKMIFSFDFVIQVGNAKNNGLHHSFDKKELYRKYMAVKKELKAKKSAVALTDKPSTLFAYNNYNLNDALFKHNQFSVCGGCGAGWRHITIMKRGDVLACRRLPSVAGNLLTDSFEDIFLNSDLIKKFRDISNQGKCSSCLFDKYCRGCPADSYALTSDLFKYNEDCMWYKEKETYNDIVYMSEMEKIRNTLFNRIISDNVPNNRRIVMALMILFNSKEQELFLHDPNGWREEHAKLGLNDDDLQYVISLVIKHNGSFNA